MSEPIFVLILLFGGWSSQSGYTAIVQEFTTLERCVAARDLLLKHHNETGRRGGDWRGGGCFKK